MIRSEKSARSVVGRLRLAIPFRTLRFIKVAGNRENEDMVLKLGFSCTRVAEVNIRRPVPILPKVREEARSPNEDPIIEL